mmetsp:Transcript_30531/g.37279  ORF Transcript_30531/g.37279 Transcript_30531/m.37279 type:complete len:215 (-) Transcript_30531:172-816(-)|eukprot:CAMPEP_0172487336 /NCGR_PEP_ID=MMETSP1066-20121228/16384_1 /TAXON_ID=671091 /ORGANISM="Coscinodiscus wailesii, Strain CCMP2513" /LENGTH=214 /DNA_ID=CAMNT_0013253887 /DNA_START=122 /DNA_END=766 /DNA_ORIENTATION=+
MVFYFTTRCGRFTLYMGKDKYENEDLIAYGQPEDCWFHVDDLSSAHVYLRMKPGMTLDDIPPEAVLDCATLVKANSIVGCKKKSVYVIYTRWKNLKKTSDMVDGQVGFHRPENIRRLQVEKDNAIVNALNKTKVEKHPDLAAEQQQRLQQIQAEKKAKRRAEDKQKRIEDAEKRRLQEESSYDRIMTSDNMTRNSEIRGTADNTAAEEYEEDFF